MRFRSASNCAALSIVLCLCVGFAAATVLWPGRVECVVPGPVLAERVVGDEILSELIDYQSVDKVTVGEYPERFHGAGEDACEQVLLQWFEPGAPVSQVWVDRYSAQPGPETLELRRTRSVSWEAFDGYERASTEFRSWYLFQSDCLIALVRTEFTIEVDDWNEALEGVANAVCLSV